MQNSQSTLPALTFRRIAKTWWPLAASWLLMALEGPAIIAVIGRLNDSTINLAAYGAVVLPIALIIESPIIMLLSASAALCKDYGTYKKLWKFMMLTGLGLTLLHFLVAFTPIYDFIVIQLIKVPAEVVEPARLGLRVMIPFAWAVGYRRFNQGLMIRFGQSGAVMNCTMLRLATLVLVLLAGLYYGKIPGVILGTIAQIIAVLVETAYSGLRARPLIKGPLQSAPEVSFSWKVFYRFYIPLMLTTLLNFLGSPISSAAVSRMPDALNSLACLAVLGNLINIMRSFGTAYNEVVVVLLDHKGSFFSLQRFAWVLLSGVSLLIVAFLITPLAMGWFQVVSALPENLAVLSRDCLWYGAIIPGLTVLQSWFSGSLMHSHKTAAITESLGIYLLFMTGILVGGVVLQSISGLLVGVLSYCVAQIVQVLWLYWRCRPTLKTLYLRDKAA